MNKNEYRRGLIMLRPIAQGYSGHVRLERRTLMGSMYFIVNLPDAPGDMKAALVGQRDGAYYAAELGTLRRDGRGQATLSYSFDPRNIDGRTLEEYMFAVIARVEGCICEPVLLGNVEGSREADFSLVEQAVCGLFTQACGPAADIPEGPIPIQPPRRPGPRPEMPLTGPGPQPSQPEQPEIPEQAPEGEAGRPAGPGQGTEGGTGQPPVPDLPAEPENGMEAAPERPAAPGQISGEEEAENGADTEDTAPAFAAGGQKQETAADAAGIDASVPWAEAIEGIRSYFAEQPARRLSFDDDFIYVRAPMPEGSGFPYVMIGIETEDGRVESVRFALPGRFSDSPPAGLDGYVWQGGPTEGWWVLTVDPRTGNPIEFDD